LIRFLAVTFKRTSLPLMVLETVPEGVVKPSVAIFVSDADVLLPVFTANDTVAVRNSPLPENVTELSLSAGINVFAPKSESTGLNFFPATLSAVSKLFT